MEANNSSLLTNGDITHEDTTADEGKRPFCERKLTL